MGLSYYCNFSDLRYFYLKDDVDSYMQSEEGNAAEGVLAKLDEQYQKYKFMEVNLIQKRLR